MYYIAFNIIHKATKQIEIMTNAQRNSITWTKDVTVCAECGRDELKGTFRIDLDAGAQYFGSSCAKKQFGYNKETLSDAKSKLNIDYNQVAFGLDQRQIDINIEYQNTNIRDVKKLKELSNLLGEIREEYKR